MNIETANQKARELADKIANEPLLMVVNGKITAQIHYVQELTTLIQKAERCDEFRLALESLTPPQGSEFVNDSKACVKWIRAARTIQHETIKKFAKERDSYKQKADALDWLAEQPEEVYQQLYARGALSLLSAIQKAIAENVKI